MEYGAIDLHLRRSQFRIVRRGRARWCGTGKSTRRERPDAGVRRLGAPMRILLESGTGERVGGAAPRGAGPRGDRGRSELRADVWVALAQGEDGRPRHGGAGRGVPAGDLSTRRIACRRRNGRCGSSCGAGGSWCGCGAAHDQSAARAAAAGRVALAVGQRLSAIAGAARRGWRCRRPGGDPRAAARRWLRELKRCSPTADDAVAAQAAARSGRHAADDGARASGRWSR